MTRPPVAGDDDWSDGNQYRDEYDNHDDFNDEYVEYEEYDEYLDEKTVPVAGRRRGGRQSTDDYEFVSVGGRSGSKLLKLVTAIAVVMLLVMGVVTLYVRGKLTAGGPAGETVTFTIPAGASTSDVAALLADQGIIQDEQMFRWYLKFRAPESGFQAGAYNVSENMAAWDVVEALSVPPLPPETIQFTVPEGLMVADIPDAIVKDMPQFDVATLRSLIEGGTIRPTSVGTQATSLEGLLFPDTYQLAAEDDEAAALQRMADQFDVVAGQLNMEQRAQALGYSPYEIVIVASLIQAEYGIVEEMPKIARVIYNRLDTSEPLGIDATSRYEAVLNGRDRGDIDFESSSPYNTRRQRGLPPTPISVPGRAALEAALNPADGDWIYYVRDPDASRTPPGGHFFTDSTSEFLEVKADCAAADLGCG